MSETPPEKDLEPTDEGLEKRSPGHKEPVPAIPPRIIVAGFLVVVGLLVVAVVVGLLRDQVNVDGLIIALMPVITGVIVGSLVKPKSKDNG